MKRIPEKPLMEGTFQVKSYSDANFSRSDKEYVLRLEEFLASKKKLPSQDDLLVDLGCGPGNITELLAERWPKTRVVGIDGSQMMLAEALRRERRLDLENLEYVNLFLSAEMVQASDLFLKANIVVSNSLLHHFPYPSSFWKVLKSIAEPLSLVFHRDLRRPDSFEQMLSLQKKHLPIAPEILISDYMASLQASFTVEEVREQLKNEELSKLQVVEVDDRYIDIFGEL